MKCTPSVCLADAPLGVSARIVALSGEPQLCCRLREFGFCESALIERLSGAGTLLCLLGSTKIALNRQLGKFIQVELLA